MNPTVQKLHIMSWRELASLLRAAFRVVDEELQVNLYLRKSHTQTAQMFIQVCLTRCPSDPIAEVFYNPGKSCYQLFWQVSSKNDVGEQEITPQVICESVSTKEIAKYAVLAYVEAALVPAIAQEQEHKLNLAEALNKIIET